MGDFEKDLQNAFEGAEFTPSPQVWDGVKAGIAPKKKVGIFYMWQTYGIAASIIFLFTMGFLFRDQFFTTGEGAVGTEELSEDGKTDSTTATGEKDLSEDKTDLIAKKEPTNPNEKNENNAIALPITDSQLQASNTDAPKQNISSNDKADGSLNIPASNLNINKLTDEQVLDVKMLTELQAAHKALDEGGVDIYVLEPQEYRESIAEMRLRWELKNMVGPLKMDSALLKDLNETTLEARRTSLNGNFGSGSFSPNGNSSNQALSENIINLNPQSASFDVTNGEERQLGSLSIGAGIGIELGRKWMLKTGLRYSQYRYASTSNAYSLEDGNPLPLNLNATFDASAIRYAGEYELTNTIHSISVPVQIGYKLLDLNRFDIMLNAGLGVDFFVGYTVKGDLNFLETRKVDLGESDFLNRFNVNVLTGLELSYELNDKFGLSAEVFFRQYIPSLNQTDGVAQANPSFLGFGLGVNYFLRKKK